MSNILKKKRKRNFIQRMKHNSTSIRFTKGVRLPDEEHQYYMRVLEQLYQIEGEEKGILIKNFYREILKEGKVQNLAQNQIVSRILDSTLMVTSLENVTAIMNVFLEDLRMLCIDPFASHVVQTLLILSLKYIQDNASQKLDEETVLVDDKSKEYFQTFLLKTSKFVHNNLEEFVSETFASHILRTVLEVCSGVESSSTVNSGRKVQIRHKLKDDSEQILVVPEELTKVLYDIIDRLKKLPAFADVIINECGSASIQTALLTLSKSNNEEKISDLINHVVENGFLKFIYTNDGIHPLFENNPSCRLMEVIISIASSSDQDRIFASFFEDKFHYLVQHKFGNFTVQKLLSFWKSKESFSTLYDSVSEHLENAFAKGYTGVLLALVQACKRLNSCQLKCIKRLKEFFECFDSEESEKMIAPLLLYLLKFNSYKKMEDANQLPPYSLHGTLVLQELLHFKNPIMIVDSILDIPNSNLVSMACHPKGSHVIDAFVSSTFIGGASRTKLISKLEGSWVTLACSKFGSHSLENIFNVVDVTVKSKIGRELYEHKNKLTDSKIGIIIFNKFHIDSFSNRDVKDWEELQLKEQKKKEILKSFLDETTSKDTEETVEPSPKKRKKNKNKKNK